MRWPAVVRNLSKAAPTIVVAAALGLVVAGAGTAAGQSSLTAIDTAYTQDFNTLASSGQSDVLPNGWALAEAGSSANNNGRYTAGTGQQQRR
jgi:ABC-type phosphate transport system substrate-binding protein